MKLVLHPSFIVMDIEAIQEGDRIYLKSVIPPQTLQQQQQMHALELLKSQTDYLKSMTYQNQSLGGQISGDLQQQQDPFLFTNTLNENPDIQAQFIASNGGTEGAKPARRRGKRGRPRLNPLEEGKSNYYFSIKAATASDREFDKDSLVFTPNFQDFDFQCGSRDDLIHNLKILAAKAGFKAIIPFTDRNNKISTSTTFCCSLAGTSHRKKSTNCPFKISYIKFQAEQIYKLQPDHFPYHNHILPIQDFFKENGFNEDEIKEVNIVAREQEQILGKLMKKKDKKSDSQYSGSSKSSHEKKSKKKDKKSKKKKKKKEKKEKKEKEYSSDGDKSSDDKTYLGGGVSHKKNADTYAVGNEGQSSQEILIFDE